MYTVWNFRRDAQSPVIDAGGEAAVAAVAAELALTERALMRNPKSYATWHHRRWAVASGFCSLEREIQLVEKLLDADDRNFHGWGYRQFIAQRMGMPAERELDYTMKKIEQNFSNYSAWHYRTALLPVLHTSTDVEQSIISSTIEQEQGHLENKEENTSTSGGVPTSVSAAVPAEVLDNEFEVLKQALYTEPSDQSGWLYHRWLLGCCVARYEAVRGNGGDDDEASAAAARAALTKTLTTQAAMCEELMEVEPDVKWPLVTLTRLKQLLGQLGEGETSSSFSAEEAYRRLIEIDGMRSGFYGDAEQGKADVVGGRTVVFN